MNEMIDFISNEHIIRYETTRDKSRLGLGNNRVQMKFNWIRKSLRTDFVDNIIQTYRSKLCVLG